MKSDVDSADEVAMLVQRTDDWLTAKIGDEVVMMNRISGKYIGLNKVGVRIWEILVAPKTVEEICTALLAQFKVAPEACRAEVEAFLSELKDNNAVTLTPAE